MGSSSAVVLSLACHWRRFGGFLCGAFACRIPNRRPVLRSGLPPPRRSPAERHVSGDLPGHGLRSGPVRSDTCPVISPDTVSGPVRSGTCPVISPDMVSGPVRSGTCPVISPDTVSGPVRSGEPRPWCRAAAVLPVVDTGHRWLSSRSP